MESRKLLDKKPGGDGLRSGESELALYAREHCELIQNMIDISMSNLRGLRTQCAASNDLTQQEIRTLEPTAGVDPKRRKNEKKRLAKHSMCGLNPGKGLEPLVA